MILRHANDLEIVENEEKVPTGGFERRKGSEDWERSCARWGSLARDWMRLKRLLGEGEQDGRAGLDGNIYMAASWGTFPWDGSSAILPDRRRGRSTAKMVSLSRATRTELLLPP